MDHTLVNGPRVDQVYLLVHVDCTFGWVVMAGETKLKCISHVLKVYLSHLASCISQMCR